MTTPVTTATGRRPTDGPRDDSRSRRSRRLVRRRRGATAMLLAVCAVPLIGVLGLAVDIGVFFRQRRNLQNAADAAALAWAHERYSHPATGTAGADARLATAATMHGFTHGQSGTLITSAVITWGTTSNAIRVTIRDTVPTLFGSVLGVTRKVVAATAVATFDLAASTSCVYSLDPDEQKALDISGNGSIIMPGCGVTVNSTANNGLYVQGSVTLSTNSTGVAGGYVQAGNGATVSPAPVTGVLQAPDPLASIAIPATPSGCTYNAVTIAPSATTSLSPGTYCGKLDIKGTVNFAPGTYFLLAGMDVSADAVLNGSNVLFINTTRTGITAGKIDMQGGPTLNLQSDPNYLQGILFYQSPLLTGTTYEATIRGDLNSNCKGTLYFPNSHLDMSGNSDFTMVGSIIANTIEMGGNGTLTVPVLTSGNAGWFTVKRVTLVD